MASRIRNAYHYVVIIVLAAAIFFAIGINTQSEAAGQDTIYTQFTSGNTVSRGTGTVSDPFNLFKDALAAVEPGGTIYIIGKGFINGDENGKLPFIIGKNVNIASYDAANPSLLDVRGSGIVLGGNVSFENIELGLSSKCHDAIFANGYELTLTNIQYSPGTRTIDLFAGGLDYLQPDASYWENEKVVLPDPGEKGVITVSVDGNYAGTEDSVFGNIYGGSMNKAWNGSAEINLIAKDGSKKLKTGDIYACGAFESDSGNPFDTNYEPDPPTPSADYFPTAGDVKIRLSNQNVTRIDGETGSAGRTSVDYEDAKGYLNSYTVFKDVSGISVKGIANLKPAAGSSFKGLPDFSIAESAILDLGNLGSEITVHDFTGGGTLILQPTQAMIVEGTVSGSTSVGIDSLTYDGKSNKPPVEDHTYITITGEGGDVSEETFIFLEYPASPGLTPKFNPYKNSWITAYEVYEPVVDSFAFSDGSKSAEAEYIEFNQGDGVGVSYGMSIEMGSGEAPERIPDVPFKYFVKDLWDDSVYEAEYDYDTDIGRHYGIVEELPLHISVSYGDGTDDWALYVCQNWNVGDYIPVGEYEITVSYPKGEETLEDTVRLIITKDSDVTEEDVVIKGVADLVGIPKALDAYYEQPADIIDALPDTLTAYLNNGERKALALTWTCASYDAKAGAVNTFQWTADPGTDSVADDVVLSGEVTISNKAPTPVTITAEHKTISYSETADVSELFQIDTDAVEASYEIVSGGSGIGTLQGSVLTVEKPGTFKIKATTPENGNYFSGSAIALLTVDPIRIISIEAPAFSETVLSVYHDDVSTIMPLLPKTVSVVTETEEGTETFEISWSCNDYDKTAGAVNTFRWEIKAASIIRYDVGNNATSGTIIIENKAITDLSEYEAVLEKTTVTYDGAEQKPAITVTDPAEDGQAGMPLALSRDYSVTYSNNLYPGTAKVTITGIGNYTGTIEKTFRIRVPDLAAPKTVSVNLYGYDDFKASWSEVSGATGYYVYYKRSTAKSYTLLGTTSAVSYKKANLTDGAAYHFRIYPYVKINGKTYKDTSYKSSSNVYALKKLSKPTVKKKSRNYIKINWTNIPGETGYQITRSSKSGSGYKVVKTVSSKYKTANIKTKRNKTYYYKIRAYKTVSGKKIYGPWSAVRSYKLR